MDVESLKTSWNNISNKLPEIINPNSDQCKLWKCNNCYGVYVIFIIVILILFIYGSYLVATYGFNNLVANDFMNQTVFKLPSGEPISYWPISHFVLFLILGFLFPGCWLLLIVAGILWEVFEMAMGKVMNRSYHHVTRTNGNVQYEQWIQGSFMDIFMDIGGIIVGLLLRYIVDSCRNSNKTN